MKLNKLALSALMMLFVLLFISAGMLLAQEPAPKLRHLEDGSMVEDQAGSVLSSNNEEVVVLGNHNFTNNATSISNVVTITEYSVPISPTNLLVNQTGDVWFSSFADNAMGKLDLASEQVFVYSRQDDGGNVWAVKQDSTGNIWYSTVNADQNDVVGKLELSTDTFVEWPISPGPNYGLDINPVTGDIWFATRDDAVGVNRLSPATNDVTNWSTFPYVATYALDIDPDGNIWLTVQPLENQGVIRLNPTTNEMIVWEMPTTDSRPVRVFAETSDEIWFTEFAPVANSIAQLIPSTNALSEFYVPVPDSFPGDLLKNGNETWFTAHGANSIGQLDITLGSPTTITILSPITLPATRTVRSIVPYSYTANIQTVSTAAMTRPVTKTVLGAFTMLSLSTDNSRPFGIALASVSEDVWITASNARYIGKLTTGEGERFRVYLPLALKD